MRDDLLFLWPATLNVSFKSHRVLCHSVAAVSRLNQDGSKQIRDELRKVSPANYCASLYVKGKKKVIHTYVWMSSHHKFVSSLAADAFSTSISQLLMHHILNSVVICAKTANEFFFFLNH